MFSTVRHKNIVNNKNNNYRKKFKNILPNGACVVAYLGTVMTAAEAMAATTNADTMLRKIILRDG